MSLRKPNQRNGNRKDQSGKWAADGDVEQAFAIGDSRFLKDDRSHGAEGRNEWKRDEKWAAGRHTVAAGLQIVPHFVREENRHHSDEIDRAVLEHRGQELVKSACQISSVEQIGRGCESGSGFKAGGEDAKASRHEKRDDNRTIVRRVSAPASPSGDLATGRAGIRLLRIERGDLKRSGGGTVLPRCGRWFAHAEVF
jgi:hypothetical protein